MKACMVCGHVAPDFAKSCRCCGEASWRKEPHAQPTPPDAVELDEVESLDDAQPDPEPAQPGSSHASRGRRGRRR